MVQPVIAGASGRAVGVLELELPYDAIAQEVAAATTRTFQRLGVGLGALYVVLALISWSTTRRLRADAAQAAHAAVHDPLTGLGNRELFRHRVEAATRADEELAVVLVDLDRFKQVNDTLGHHAGDELLRTVARRLTDSLRTDDVVTRLGGDEFGLVLPGITGAEEVHSLLVRVSLALGESVELDGVPVAVEASFGVALHPRDGHDTESLLRAADAAMYQGKRGTSSIVVYDPRIESTPAGGLAVQSELRRALDHDELVLHYQPVVDLVTGEVTRLEALVRWQHPERGLVYPADFVPAVEQSSLVQPFTRWVLARALEDCATWTAAGAPWEVSVNVSVRNLDDAFPDEVLSRLDAQRRAPLAPAPRGHRDRARDRPRRRRDGARPARRLRRALGPGRLRRRLREPGAPAHPGRRRGEDRPRLRRRRRGERGRPRGGPLARRAGARPRAHRHRGGRRDRGGRRLAHRRRLRRRAGLLVRPPRPWEELLDHPVLGPRARTSSEAMP